MKAVSPLPDDQHPSTGKGRRFPFGLCLGLLLLSACKWTYLFFQIGNAAGTEIFCGFVLEISLFYLLSTLALLIYSYLRTFFSLLIVLLLLLMLSFFYLDTGLIISLNQRGSIADLLRFASQGDLLNDFLLTRSMLGVTGLIVCSLIWWPRRTIQQVRLHAAWAVFFSASGAFAPLPAPTSLTSAYRISPSMLLTPFRQGPQEMYPAAQAHSAAATYARRSLLTLPAQAPPIICVIVESLSAIDIPSISGIPGNAGWVDELAQRGTLFTNFMANSPLTEGGLVSFFNAAYPFTAPLATGFPHRDFGVLPSVISQFRERGYFTEFLTTSPLRFSEKGLYLASIGFHQYRGRDEVTEFQQAPWHVFKSPSDAFLYTEGLRRVEDLSRSSRPWFLALETVSSHRPWTDPEGIENSEERVWSFVGTQLVKFVQELDARNYFDTGLLIITSDHRKMYPIPEKEAALFGESARARIPLLVIGNSVAAGKKDPRLLQQADLFPLFSKVLEGDAQLSSFALFTGRDSNAWSDLNVRNELQLFLHEGSTLRSLSPRLVGNSIEWQHPSPGITTQQLFEEQIHLQRAAHQHFLSNVPRCPARSPAPAFQTGTQHGLLVTRLPGASHFDVASPLPENGAEWEVTDSYSLLPGKGPATRQSDNFHQRAFSYLQIPESAEYAFYIRNSGSTCLYLDGELLFDKNNLLSLNAATGIRFLTEGAHLLELRYSLNSLDSPGLRWGVNGMYWYEQIPSALLRLPVPLVQGRTAVSSRSKIQSSSDLARWIETLHSEVPRYGFIQGCSTQAGGGEHCEQLLYTGAPNPLIDIYTKKSPDTRDQGEP